MVREIHGGWGSITVLDGDHIYRFARDTDVAAAQRREYTLLPRIAEAVSFRVPEPDFFGEWGDDTCIGYPLIEGRPFTDADDWRSLAGILRELHDVPIRQATDWRGYYERLRTRIADLPRVDLPRVDLAQADLPKAGLPTTELAKEYDRFLDADWDFEPVLVHRDLAPEHILVDPHGRIVGLIDFEDATLGDPAIDFAGLLPILGPDRVDELIADYGRPVDRDRLLGYWWLAPVHDLLHGLAIHDTAIVTEATAEISVRLSAVDRARRA